ncbi:MAG: tagatose 1,6-diphosphate aldolase [Candidatus Kapaibacterium sp.]
MSRFKITKGKFEGIQACAGPDGVIAAAAMDQRGSLKKSIGKAQGREATDAELTQFKISVSKVLTPHATALLMDPEYGLPALKVRGDGCGVLLSYEKTGYDATLKGRLPDLLDEWSAYRLAEEGADAVKILLYYNPFDNERTNRIKHAFIERVGAECRAVDKPFFLEVLAYDDACDEKGVDFAKLKPKYVAAYMKEYSLERYGVDVLKVEVPVNMKFVSGTAAFEGGEAAQTREETLQLFREAGAAATKPFIYLSAGVTDDVFRETIELAGEADSGFSGVLCGRATWQDGIAVYGSKGTAALEAWLAERGVENIEKLNTIVHAKARPWYAIYGGLENIDVI